MSTLDDPLQSNLHNQRKPATDARTDEVTVVHCTADSSSSNMSRRDQVVRAVRRPVSKGSRHCVNLLKELLPKDAIHDIAARVSSGETPQQAVEAVTHQRLGPQAAADVTKLVVAVWLASSAAGSAVTASKALLCLLASPLHLGNPMRWLTSLLVPTPLASGLLGCCLVLHTAREVAQPARRKQRGPSAAAVDKGSTAQHKAAGHVDGVSCEEATGSECGADLEHQQQQQQRGRPWWAVWQRHSRGPKGAADTPAQQQQQGVQEAGTGALADGGTVDGSDESSSLKHAELAPADESATRAAAGLSPAGPFTPDPHHTVFCKHTASSSGGTGSAAVHFHTIKDLDADTEADTDAAAQAGAAADAEAGNAVVSTGVFTTLHKLDSSSLDDTATAGGDNADAASEQAASAAAGSAAQPAPFPLSPTTSLKPVATPANAVDTQPAAAEAKGAAAEAALSPTAARALSPQHYLLRRRSSSGTADAGFCGEPLSPTSSGSQTPMEEIEGQAAEVSRRWSMGHHADMIPDPKSFTMLQQQPYRPPVFTRLSSGRGGCRITAAAAAAAAREQHAAQQAQRRQAQMAAAAAAGGGDGGCGSSNSGSLRRYHSLDMQRTGQVQEQSFGMPTAAAPSTGALSAAAAAAAASAAVDLHSIGTSAPLPPLPAGGAREHGHVGHHEQQQQQQQQLSTQLSAELLQLDGVVRQRSLDWGHKLCKIDSM